MDVMATLQSAMGFGWSEVVREECNQFGFTTLMMMSGA